MNLKHLRSQVVPLLLLRLHLLLLLLKCSLDCFINSDIIGLEYFLTEDGFLFFLLLIRLSCIVLALFLLSQILGIFFLKRRFIIVYDLDDFSWFSDWNSLHYINGRLLYSN